MKYGAVAILLLFNNELVSLLALSVMALLFLFDIVVARTEV